MIFDNFHSNLHTFTTFFKYKAFFADANAVYDTFYFHGVVSVFIVVSMFLTVININSSFVFSSTLAVNELWWIGNRRLNTAGTKSKVIIFYTCTLVTRTQNFTFNNISSF